MRSQPFISFVLFAVFFFTCINLMPFSAAIFFSFVVALPCFFQFKVLFCYSGCNRSPAYPKAHATIR